MPKVTLDSPTSLSQVQVQGPQALYPALEYRVGDRLSPPSQPLNPETIGRHEKLQKKVFLCPLQHPSLRRPGRVHDRTGLYLKYYLTPMPTLARGCRGGCACSQTTVNIAHRAFGRRGFFAVTRIPSAQPGPGWSRWEGEQSAGETSSWGATSHAVVCGNNICAI
jgi:hypothetical protein